MSNTRADLEFTPGRHNKLESNSGLLKANVFTLSKMASLKMVCGWDVLQYVVMLPEEKKVMQGFGQCCLILYGSTPGMDQKCK